MATLIHHDGEKAAHWFRAGKRQWWELGTGSEGCEWFARRPDGVRGRSGDIYGLRADSAIWEHGMVHLVAAQRWMVQGWRRGVGMVGAVWMASGQRFCRDTAAILIGQGAPTLMPPILTTPRSTRNTEPANASDPNTPTPPFPPSPAVASLRCTACRPSTPSLMERNVHLPCAASWSADLHRCTCESEFVWT